MLQPFIHDCDPGADDSVALLYLLASGRTPVAVTVTDGNESSAVCAQNARATLSHAGYSHVPVLEGHDAVTALLSLPDKAEILATAPLTNIAAAVGQDPNWAARMGRIVVMGGCPAPDPLFGEWGNVNDNTAELNFAAAPDAAKTVLNAGFKDLLLVGLNATRPFLYSDLIAGRLLASGHAYAPEIIRILSESAAIYAPKYDTFKTHADEPVQPVHDLLTAYAFLHPMALPRHRMRLSITENGATRPSPDGIPVDVVPPSLADEIWPHIVRAFAV